jgi:hypothetical protein
MAVIEDMEGVSRLWVVVFDISSMFILAESQAPAGLADIVLVAGDAWEWVYTPRVVWRGWGVLVLGGFEVLKKGVGVSEGYSNICVFEEVGDFSNQGGRKSEHRPLGVVLFFCRKREGRGNGARKFSLYAVFQSGY